MAITQKNREIGIETPLGEDVLLLASMSGTEQLGRPFEFELVLASEDHQIKSADIVGQNVTVRLELSEAKTRYFNGYISRFTQAPATGRLASYRATVVSWLWFLTQTADCRIFPEMTVPDIIKLIFREHGFTDFEALQKKWQKRQKELLDDDMRIKLQSDDYLTYIVVEPNVETSWDRLNKLQKLGTNLFQNFEEQLPVFDEQTIQIDELTQGSLFSPGHSQ